MKYLIKIILIFQLLLFGCDFFGTRKAEIPTSPGSIYQPATTPDILISNFRNSLADNNVVNYLICLADSNFTSRKFHFSPSASAVSQFPSLTDDWDLKHEEQYFNNLVSKVLNNATISLNFDNINSSQFSDSLIYSASYTLTVPLTDQTIPENYQGDLKFTMIRDARSVWVIYNWQDTKNSDVPSWSELKGRFY